MEFPKIKKSEYAVLMADSNTGVVLDIYILIFTIRVVIRLYIKYFQVLMK